MQQNAEQFNLENYINFSVGWYLVESVLSPLDLTTCFFLALGGALIDK